MGKNKIDIAKERIKDINPNCDVDAQQMFYLPENADEIDLTSFDYVVDCIDTMAAKMELIKTLHYSKRAFIIVHGRSK